MTGIFLPLVGEARLKGIKEKEISLLQAGGLLDNIKAEIRRGSGIPGGVIGAESVATE